MLYYSFFTCRNRLSNWAISQKFVDKHILRKHLLAKSHLLDVDRDAIHKNAEIQNRIECKLTNVLSSYASDDQK